MNVSLRRALLTFQIPNLVFWFENSEKIVRVQEEILNQPCSRFTLESSGSFLFLTITKNDI